MPEIKGGNHVFVYNHWTDSYNVVARWCIPTVPGWISIIFTRLFIVHNYFKKKEKFAVGLCHPVQESGHSSQPLVGIPKGSA
jgi:hypothetical protein